MSTGKLILGVLGGVAAGALLGVLFAPEEGKVTRKKIKTKANDSAEDLKEKFDSLLDSMNQKYKSISQVEQQIVSNSKAHLDL
jgi:gas vesicle protein